MSPLTGIKDTHTHANQARKKFVFFSKTAPFRIGFPGRDRPRRPLLLGVRWGAAAPGRIADYTESLLEAVAAVESRGTTIPVHWNLAPHLHLERAGQRLARLIGEIRTRAAGRGDRVLPCGYAGALHPLLSGEELEKELAWSRENPWSSGIRTLFGQDPEAILPVYPDLPREASHGIYRLCGFTAVGVAVSRVPPGPVRFLHSLAAGAPPSDSPGRPPGGNAPPPPARIFVCLPFPAPGSLPELKAGLRTLLRAAGPDPLFLLLDYTTLVRMEARWGIATTEVFSTLRAGLEYLAARNRTRFIALTDALGRPAPGDNAETPLFGPEAAGADAFPPGLPAPPVPLDPVTRAAWRRLRDSRPPPAQGSSVPAEESLRRLLRSLAPAEEGHASRRPEAAGPGAAGPAKGRRPAGKASRKTAARAVTTGITGSIMLAGTEFDACFRNGQLLGLLDKATPAPGGKHPADHFPPSGLPGSFLTVSGRRRVFQVESCDSFEGDSEMGLGVHLALPPFEPARGAGSIAADYTFRDDRPNLRLDLTIQYPDLPAETVVEESVPMEIPLAFLAAEERVEILCFFPDGSCCRTGLPKADCPLVLSGERFSIARPQQRIHMDFPPGGRSIRLVQFRLEILLNGSPPPRSLRLRETGTSGMSAPAFVLLVNPFGSYFPAPAAHFSGWREEFSLLLRLESAPGG